MADESPSRDPARDAFGVLGPLEVRRSGRAVLLGGPRQRAALALLLVEANRAVSVDRLASDVWGGHPAEGRVATVPAYVVHLCRALEPSPGAPGGGARAEADVADGRPSRRVPMIGCGAAV